MKHALLLLFIAAIFVVVSTLRASPQLTEAEARARINQGALIVDVRTVEEFNAKHLTNVLNIPLAEVREKLPLVVTNQGQVILLHCRTGRRSGIAEGELRSMGYTNAFNIGSYERAEKIISGKW